MSDGDFKKIGESEQKMYGPRGFIACGYEDTDQKIILGMLVHLKLTDLNVIFASVNESQKTLAEIVSLPERTGYEEKSGLDRAIIMSGLTERELKAVMGTYRQAGIPSPLWATMTPTTENWTLEQLLKELAAEAEAFRKMREQQQKSQSQDPA